MSLYPARAFYDYFLMWNETDMTAMRSFLDQSVTEDVIFCDPLHWHVGRDALASNVETFRAEYPTAKLFVSSGMDAHHNRVRYHWDITIDDRLLVRGFDVATLAESGLIERIDGFFGPVPSLRDEGLSI
jgi:hypothetical protein